MIIDNIDDYSRDELLELAKSSKVTTFPLASNPSKPNKTEIAQAIEDQTESAVVGVTVDPESVEKKSKFKQQKDELFKLQRVVVTEVYKPAVYQNDDSNRVEFITWGNRLVKYHTNRVIFGKPWILPEGCIRNLEAARYVPVSNKGSSVAYGQPSPSYRVERLSNPTQRELDDIGKVQQLREIKGV